MFRVSLSNELAPISWRETVRVLIKITAFPGCYGFLNTKANTLKTAVTNQGYGSPDIIIFYTKIVQF